MVNGVDVNDNLFANAQNLFIEDAIEETQVLTSGISAEYGRFSGGVVNAITKSGGNAFSGSYRLNLLNPSWSQETPFEVTSGTTYPDTLQHTHEGTFGGPIIKDSLWFFTAGRYGSVDSTVNLVETGTQLISNDLNKRGEIKLTGTVATDHTLQGGYLNNPRTRTNNSGLQAFVIDPNSEVDRSNPNHYYFTNYRGVFGNMLVEAQYSQRKFKFADDGGTSTNILDSPFVALECLCVYNAPYFDATDPENRNNRQLTGNVTTFWDGRGRHDTKVGYEFFRSQRTGGNSQSSTSYVFNADFLRGPDERPAVDAQGRIIPVFVPGESYLEFFPATRGAVMDVDNNSAFVQDHWVISDNLSADLGLRFEQVKVTSTGDITSINTSPRFVPRLGLSYDVRGTGNHVVHVTYGQYSGRYNEAQVAGNSPVGNPAYLPLYYAGPAGQGRDFAAGINLANYPVTPDNLAGTPEVPTANIFVDEGLKSQLTHEFTTSYGITMGTNGRGYAEATYVFRKTNNLIEDFTTRADGTTSVVLEGLDLGVVSNVVYRNTDVANREYQAMIFQGRYRIFNNLSVNGNYTVQLKNDGNFEGEGTNTPGSSSRIGDYPEAQSEARYYPDGRLQNFQRHRMRFWTIYNLDVGRAGRVSLSGLWRVDSGLAYSLAVRNLAPSATQRALVAAAGYPDLPGPGNVFFAERGSETFKGYGLFDTSVNYDVPVFRSLRPWVKFDVFNLFNNQKLIAWNTTISPDATTPVDNLGIRTGFIRSANFGRATGNTVTNLNSTAIPAYPQWSGGFNGGRTFRVAMGIRF
jgi:hypothetical protein